MLSAFIHGFILAFGLILPLGPQNAFVLSQGASNKDWRCILPVVLTASAGDSALILVAVLGVSMVVLSLPWIRTGLLAGGILFLVVIGWLTWKNDPGCQEPPGKKRSDNWSLRRRVTFTLALSLFNPHAILDTVAVIGPNALVYQGQARATFTAACILNSWVWFFSLALFGRLAGSLEIVRRWLNRFSALVMWGSALYLLAGLIAQVRTVSW